MIKKISGWLILTSVLLIVLTVSCENKIDFIPKSDFLSIPSLTVHNFKTVYSDSGKIQLIMTSPLLEQFDNADAKYYEFRNGIKVDFYNGEKNPTAKASSKYAKYFNKENRWELKDSVVIINETGDKLETEVLYWDQQKDLIYTDRFVRITNQDQIIMGTGFESDPRLERRRIKKVSATIYLKDEK
jgi:LPS export ABC transporter protein LptC